MVVVRMLQHFEHGKLGFACYVDHCGIYVDPWRGSRNPARRGRRGPGRDNEIVGAGDPVVVPILRAAATGLAGLADRAHRCVGTTEVASRSASSARPLAGSR